MKKKRILVIEDEMIMRVTLKDALALDLRLQRRVGMLELARNGVERGESRFQALVATVSLAVVLAVFRHASLLLAGNEARCVPVLLDACNPLFLRADRGVPEPVSIF